MLTFAKCFKKCWSRGYQRASNEINIIRIKSVLMTDVGDGLCRRQLENVINDQLKILLTDFLQPTSQNCHHQKVTNHLRTVSWVNLKIYQKLKYVIVFSVSSLYSIVTKCFNQKMNCSKSIRNRHLISKLIDRTWRFGCNDSIIDIISRWLSLINSPRCTFSDLQISERGLIKTDGKKSVEPYLGSIWDHRLSKKGI